MLEDVTAFVGIIFRFIASIIAIGAVIYLLFKRAAFNSKNIPNPEIDSGS